MIGDLNSSKRALDHLLPLFHHLLSCKFKRNIFDSQIGGAYRHIGVYGYKRDTLIRCTELETSKNESVEKLEQLRAIDNGIKINAIIKDYDSISIDTEQDLENLIKSLNLETEI